MSQIDYTNYAPMGRIKGGMRAMRAALDPRKIASGFRAFENEARLYQAKQREMALAAQAQRREMARKAKMASDFARNFPAGSAEKLLKNYINKNPLFNPWRLK